MDRSCHPLDRRICYQIIEMTKRENKIILVGNTGVGKSSLMYRLVTGRKPPPQVSTIGAAYNLMVHDYDDKQYYLGFWDTAGQERYRSLVKLYYQGSRVCICVFDVSNKESFTNTEFWVAEYRSVNPDGGLLLVGNKCDLPFESWKVTDAEISRLAGEYECSYLIISSHTGMGTDVILDTLCNCLEESDESLLSDEPFVKHGCC